MVAQIWEALMWLIVFVKTKIGGFPYRKDEPEKEAIPEALLQRRLQAQKYAKVGITARRQTELQRILAEEKQRAKRSQKARRERAQFKASESSSSSDSDSSDS